MQKNGKVYRNIILMWGLLLIAAAVPFFVQIRVAFQNGITVGLLVLLSTLFIAYFWLNGIKDIIYTAYFYRHKKRLLDVPEKGLYDGQPPRIVMVYCTYNDFDGRSLERCLQQHYANVYTAILDDSTDPKKQEEVNQFALTHKGVGVVRRPDRKGFKAGNLNNFLQHADYDYVVILDSDEVIPPDFISRALDYFAAYKNAGIVQANHIATRNQNQFMGMYSIGVDSHWSVYQAVKHQNGFLSMLGHGAMISRECYEAAGGFPEVVAEDLCLSINARSQGYYVVFAPDIICEEEYPVNYPAFKKRHSKWTQGNMEFIKRYSVVVLRSPMAWFEKLDIILFTYSLPLTFFFFSYLLINVVVLPLVGHAINYPAWMLLPTIAFLAAPTLNDFIYYFRRKRLRSLVNYLGHSFLLYGSMFYTSLRASLKSLFGSSTFIVTPKSGERMSWRTAFLTNAHEIIFVSILLCATLIIDRSPFPCLLMVISGLGSVYLTRMSNKRLIPGR